MCAVTTFYGNGTIHKRIPAAQTREQLVDAIADLLHVHGGNEGKLAETYFEALTTARTHYEAEANRTDGDYVIEVTA